ncbi:hypothetical protein BJY52DRAFT_117178 [Lactarius psammicola]|nr:hypothetical protein BJY52DRAFT_117178 [Lactarius psammicola]
MESFSWSDSLRALAAPCLSCLRASKNERNDLEDLLADSGSGTTTDRDAETLSLHSNPGAPRRKRARFTKTIRLFGWNLFGRPPIRLPDDDDEEEEEGARAGREQGQGSRRSRRSRRPPPTALSSSTLDSDAAPLDSAAIESHATRRAEEEAARAERRARRRERKERKRAALALALEHAAVLDGNAEFEGFPGSGDRRPPPASPFARGSEDYRDDDDEDEEGDFGAGAYARRTRGGSDSGRGSDSRSRTSTSLSSGPQQQQGQPYNHHYISQQPSAHPAVPPPPPPVMPPLPAQRSKKGKSSRSSASKTSSSSRRSHSSPSASQSPSLASPVATQFSDAVPAPAPRTAQEFEGFPSDLGLHTAGIERLSSGFPSPGIGGRRNGKRDMGAFLANRGDA